MQDGIDAKRKARQVRIKNANNGIDAKRKGQPCALQECQHAFTKNRKSVSRISET
jgi:hypothetical protein